MNSALQSFVDGVRFLSRICGYVAAALIGFANLILAGEVGDYPGEDYVAAAILGATGEDCQCKTAL